MGSNRGYETVKLEKADPEYFNVEDAAHVNEHKVNMKPEDCRFCTKCPESLKECQDSWADRIFGVPDKDGKRKAFTARATGTSGKNKW